MRARFTGFTVCIRTCIDSQAVSTYENNDNPYGSVIGKNILVTSTQLDLFFFYLVQSHYKCISKNTLECNPSKSMQRHMFK
jgi:hypothetical protein